MLQFGKSGNLITPERETKSHDASATPMYPINPLVMPLGDSPGEDVLRNVCPCSTAVCLHFCKTGKTTEHSSGAWIPIQYVVLGDFPRGVHCRTGPVGRTQHAVKSAGRHASNRFRGRGCGADFAAEFQAVGLTNFLCTVDAPIRDPVGTMRCPGGLVFPWPGGRGRWGYGRTPGARPVTASVATDACELWGGWLSVQPGRLLPIMPRCGIGLVGRPTDGRSVSPAGHRPDRRSRPPVTHRAGAIVARTICWRPSCRGPRRVPSLGN